MDISVFLLKNHNSTIQVLFESKFFADVSLKVFTSQSYERLADDRKFLLFINF